MSSYYQAKKREAGSRRRRAISATHGPEGEESWRCGPGRREEGFTGARKIWLELNSRGIPVARCTVERLMRELGIRGVSPGRKRPPTTRLRSGDPADTGRPTCWNGVGLRRSRAENRRWVRGHHLRADLFRLEFTHRFRLAWTCSPAGFSAGRSLTICAPDLTWRLTRWGWRCGRGATMTFAAWCIILTAASSTRRSGTPERLSGRESGPVSRERRATRMTSCCRGSALNSLYKRELIDRKKDWLGVDDVMLATATQDWVQWYNEDRIHSYSGDMPPKKYEEIYYRALESGKLTSSSQT